MIRLLGIQGALPIFTACQPSVRCYGMLTARRTDALCRLSGPAYSERRLQLRKSAAERWQRRGEHDARGAAVVRRFTNVPRPVPHDPARDTFKSPSFATTGEWRC